MSSSVIGLKYSSDEWLYKEIGSNDFSPNGKITSDFATYELTLAGLVQKWTIGGEFTLIDLPAASELHLARIEKSIELYVKERVSLGKAAELCGIYFDEMIKEVKRRGYKLEFGPRTLEEAEEEADVIRRYRRGH